MRKLLFGFIVILNIIILAVLLYLLFWVKDIAGYRKKEVLKKPLYSRNVIEITEELVKKNKPTPPESSRAYSYVATVFSEALDKSDIYNALENTKNITIELFPTDKAFIDNKYKELLINIKPSPLNSNILEVYKKRIKEDGHGLVWDGNIPTGDGIWVKEDNEPFSPRAGEWKRWLIDNTLKVEDPPVYGSAQDQKEIDIVKDAVRVRTPEDVASINKWGGVPGSIAPAGLWQDQLFNSINQDFDYRPLEREKKYAFMQKVLAQTVADAFMECWKIKYLYWTARPSMRIDNLNIAMPNPPFPGYVSGHSTISRAAADVLSIMIPDKKDYFQAMAVEARDSRLKAGIHFNVDNMRGYELGHLVAIQSILKLDLKPILFSDSE